MLLSSPTSHGIQRKLQNAGSRTPSSYIFASAYSRSISETKSAYSGYSVSIRSIASNSWYGSPHICSAAIRARSALDFTTAESAYNSASSNLFEAVR